MTSFIFRSISGSSTLTWLGELLAPNSKSWCVVDHDVVILPRLKVVADDDVVHDENERHGQGSHAMRWSTSRPESERSLGLRVELLFFQSLKLTSAWALQCRFGRDTSVRSWRFYRAAAAQNDPDMSIQMS